MATVNNKIIEFKPALQISIFIHPNSEYHFFRELLFTLFTRDVNKPLSRGLSIPIFFFLKPDDLACFIQNKSYNALIILLIDYKMVNDGEWRDFIGLITNHVQSSKNLIKLIPVALDDTAFNLNQDLNKFNFIKFHEFPIEIKNELFEVIIQNELCKLLKSTTKDQYKLPVKLFLSHAKLDGEPIVKIFRKFINKFTELRSFFDIINISPGTKWEDVITENIKDSSVLIFQTDSFSSREWCRREVLLAKQFNCPLIIINNYIRGEERVFPYIGNIPSFHWNLKEDSILEIVKLILLETLRIRYNKKLFDKLYDYWDFTKDPNIFIRPPELLNCIELKFNSTKQVYLYPDPPLGIEELNLLNRISSSLIFTTPMQFFTSKSKKKILEKKYIGLSVSNNEDLPLEGLVEHHLIDTIVEFTRYLLASNLNINFGGNLEEGGYTNILYDLARNHTVSEESPTIRLRNFLSWPFYLKLDEKKEASLKLSADIIKVVLPEDIQDHKDFKIDFNNFDFSYYLARSLTFMRKKMIETDSARIFIGGKKSNFYGIYPGLLEEFYICIEFNKPIFLIGAFGGITYEIMQILRGNDSQCLSEDFQLKNPKYKSLFNSYNQKIEMKEVIGEKIDFSNMTKKFKKLGISSLRNGLTKEENIRLFETKYIFEMVFLIIKGLKNLKIL